jgi:hypothetical protein
LEGNIDPVNSIGFVSRVRRYKYLLSLHLICI